MVVVVVHLLVPINPDHTLPAVPELLGVALVSSILGITVSLGKTLQLPAWSIRNSESIVLSMLWLTVLGVTGPRAVLSLFRTPGQAWIPCRIVPGIATKFECLWQASITQHYGYRTFFMLVSAAILGTLAFLMARIVRQGWQILLGAVVFGSLLVTVVGFFCVALGIEQALPKSLLYNSLGSQRLTQIFGNPGWVWPYFAPGLAVVVWVTVAASTWAGRILWAGISSVLLLGVLATQQRGGLLLCIIYVTVCLFYCLIRGLKKRSLPIVSLGTMVLVVFGNALYVLFNNEQLLQEGASSIGYHWRVKPLAADTGRLEIWRGAWEIFKEAPLLGHGYASWFQMISEYGSKHNMYYVLDTSHNLFFQMLVELGLLHTLLVLGILVLIAVIVFQNTRFLPRGRLLFLLAMSSFFVPSLLQEINYIRPTFYIHALFWGTLAGLPFYTDTKLIQSSSGQRDLFLQNTIFSGKVSLIALISFQSLTASCLLLIFFCLFNFSFGGFPFEANLTQPSPSLMRWLGLYAKMAAFATPEGKTYSVFATNPVQKPISADLAEGGTDFRITAAGNEELSLALTNGGRYWPQRHDLSFSTAIPDGARWISTQIFYPPVQSNLGISWSRNMYFWETFGGRAGRWCGQDCMFLAKSCGRRDYLDFVVGAPRPDYSEAQPLSFEVSVYSMTEEIDFSSQVLQNLPPSIAHVSEQLEKPGEEKQFHFKGTPKTGWYLVRLQATSVFNPKSQGFSQDERNLALTVMETDCSMAH
ncbi:MAG TPA: hypothetical protein DDZ80_22870 [Cyanobacteria bacterium UBA8803]|nr:hypothetical protein [Cyanobacteria bacterium UBA9273]HBL61170.1 hypothetical protein [Cyanobacteria bacterium UBA8803]